MNIINTPTNVQGLQVERVVTHDHIDPDFQNNVWLVGDQNEVLVIDAAHDAPTIIEAIAGRNVTAIICTHGHQDHINAAGALAAKTSAPVYLHPKDLFLWANCYDTPPDGELWDGQIFNVAGLSLKVHHTPGHTPGACIVHAPALTTVFTGDTLFEGGPGATKWEYSSFPQIISSITDSLLTLPADTLVLTGHGPATTIGRERPDLDVWIARGW